MSTDMAGSAVAKFCVEAETKSGEVVCVSGDHALLGNWRPQHAVVLNKDPSASLQSKDIWRGQVAFPSPCTYKYRYAVCKLTTASDGGPTWVTVERWEAGLLPRSADSSVTFQTHDGVVHPDIFGYYVGKQTMRRGWLTCQSEIQLRLHSNPVSMWAGLTEQYYIRCYPIIFNIQEPHKMEVLPTEEVEVSVLDDKTMSRRHQQELRGVLYKPDSYVVFSMQTLYPKLLGFRLDLYTKDSDPPSAGNDLTGHAFVPCGSLVDTIGHILLSVTGANGTVLGQINVEYFVCKPLDGHTCDMSVTYAHHWKKKSRAMNVGHRGMGQTYGRDTTFGVHENTISSFNQVSKQGADMVEMDIQVTKDHTVIVYHDFQICTQLKKKNDETSAGEMFEIPIKDLTFNQLHDLKFYHKSSSDLHRPDDPPDRRPFPSLRDVFQSVDEDLGFFIEAKYSLQDVTGAIEQEHYIDKNVVADAYLCEILQYTGSRRVIIGAFDPDICILLRRKQNKYPVMFLTMGATPKWDSYADKRARTLDMGFNFTISEELLGISAEAGELLDHPEFLTDMADAGLVTFCWGREVEDAKVREKLEHGVAGFVYDGIRDQQKLKQNAGQPPKVMIDE